ncbi:MAG: hypothetical protein JNK16_01765 [Phycisphaerales bacterium]|nr:hypothetical protein [Phycisphaerales bacterium]
MKLISATLCSLVLAQPALAGFHPVSRASFLSSVGERVDCRDCPNGWPPQIEQWNYKESTSAFGTWGAYAVGVSMFISGYHDSKASAHVASLYASARWAHHSGNYWYITDDQKTGHAYVFDILCATRVSMRGVGQVELAASNGLRIVADELSPAGQEMLLLPGRYTLRDLFVDGYGAGELDVRVVGCLGDINSDAEVNDGDFLLFLQSYALMLCSDASVPAGCPADLNDDNMVDDADFVIFGQSYDLMVCQ